MKRQRQAPSSRKQLAFELGECQGRIALSASVAVARAVEAEEDPPSNIICIRSEIARQEQAERGMHYANIMALAKHLG